MTIGPFNSLTLDKVLFTNKFPLIKYHCFNYEHPFLIQSAAHTKVAAVNLNFLSYCDVYYCPNEFTCRANSPIKVCNSVCCGATLNLSVCEIHRVFLKMKYTKHYAVGAASVWRKTCFYLHFKPFFGFSVIYITPLNQSF